MLYLIDVRTTEEFNAGHLNDAIHIDYREILHRIDEVTTDKDAEIHLYCRSGVRSAIATQLLHSRGYYRALNIGGYEALKAHFEAQHSYQE
ncbi:rhodanese-like domain-containing protein [Wohlfahrtiimonas chitiniclastica]|uniref:rhodanese-like domain-containing protein n=1 Tax=Wohlfahrtiimonas chitiniclastica TaxID=400946 RepID=UPI0007B6979E|nr:rhodanese-like domain-containing protein [Wohlfahrtiimonas chitiniclastica]KZX37703.1 thiosulfate sulfurtransferase [Wohlfahrtiimonas chitiniclastica]